MDTNEEIKLKNGFKQPKIKKECDKKNVSNYYLSESVVEEIRFFYNKCNSLNKTGIKYNLSCHTIKKILNINN